MHILNINGIFSTTYYSYDRCLEVGGKHGPDAWTLYTFYCKQSHAQNNKQSFTLNKFVREGLGWGDDRVKNARAVLKELGLIDDVIVRDEKGVIISHYVRVNYSINENDIRTAGMTYGLSTTRQDQGLVKSRSGGMDTNTLNITNKYPEHNKNICPATEKPTDISPDDTYDIREKEKEKSCGKREKEIKGYSKDFEEWWKKYYAISGRGSKKDSYKKWLSWSAEDIELIKKKVLEECVNVNSGKKDKQRVCGFEKYMENNKGVDVDIEGLVNTYMKYTGDIKKKGLDLMKEYFGEDLIKKYIFKYVKKNENFNLDLH